MEKIIELITMIVSMLEEITTSLRSIVFLRESTNISNIVPDRRFGNSPKDRLIQRIASTLAEIVTRNALKGAIGDYYAKGTIANLESQQTLCTLVPVRFKGSKKKAYTKESVILWLYEVIVLEDEGHEIESDSVICKKAS